MTREMLPIYDAMVQLFAAAMPDTKISTQILSYIMHIPDGSMRKVIDLLPNVGPLPNGVQVKKGGHRNLEEFMIQPNFVSSVGRKEIVEEIWCEKIWAEYGVELRHDFLQIIKEVEKVLERVGELKGSNIKKGAIINSGDPEIYRLFWFVKDIMNNEFYLTVQEAIKAGRSTPSEKIPRKKKILSVKVPPLAAPLGKSVVVQPVPNLIDMFINFVDEIRTLRDTKDQYLASIKDMEQKINKEYPVLIAQKETERAQAERTIEGMKDRIKVLETINADQMTEIRNLKRHPKFAGMVKKGEEPGCPIFKR